MSLRSSYTRLAPFYDALVGPLLARARRRSLERLPRENGLQIFLNGIGTGLDLPLLPPASHYTALDLTAAMLARARPRQQALQVQWVQGDSQRLPFAASSFHHAVLHLILAIVPDTVAALRETARVIRTGGRIYVLDKFLRRGDAALLRKLLNPLASRIATRTDVVFEDALDQVRSLRIVEDRPAFAGGWFRLITLEKTGDQEGPEESGSSSSRRGHVHQTMPTSNDTAIATSISSQTSPLIAAQPLRKFVDA